ncbi:MAG TPA: helix-turn-helix domain-containing protein [Pseudogracilibacillus sp.]|nr:helix-turn-helix domain-containing protein [Pseudogracilibacillus sp.]
MRDKLLNVKDVANLLGMHEVTIRDKCRNGDIPAMKIGRHWKIKEGDLNEWLKKYQ